MEAGHQATPDADGGRPPAGAVRAEAFEELRPPRRWRIWQVVPVVGLIVAGSLMFAFPLAFQSTDSGAVIGMLGLLLVAAGAGLGTVCAYRARLRWPGLPAPGSAERARPRIVAGYLCAACCLLALALWRVVALGG